MSVENNKIIAEFMGLPLVPCSIGTENGVVYEGYQHPKGSTPFTADGLQYKYSWDWLMPVIQKCYILNDEYGFDAFDNFCDLDIRVSYSLVVDFIQEYRLTPKELN